MATKKSTKRRTPPPARKPAKPTRPERKQPETLRLRNLSPSLTVNDLGASIRWYRDVLGFTLEEEWKDGDVVVGAQLNAGAITFMMSQDDFAKGRDRVKGVGLRFYCTTAQDVDRLAADVEARGGVLAQPPTDNPWGRDFTVVDPDGFKITITNY
jgi:lactoylglutathione lyase